MRASLLLVALLTASSLSAATGPGSKAASRHARFARLLASSNIRFHSAELEKLVVKVNDDECKFSNAVGDATPERLAPVIKGYASDYCRPWMELWDDMFKVCDSDHPPEWCDDESKVLEQLDLDGYFDGLIEALRSSRGDLERENLFDMILAPFSAHVIGDFGKEPPDRWATEAVRTYVGMASFEQVVDVTKRFQNTWVGLTPGVVEELDQYAQTADGLTPDQREELAKLITRRFSKE